MTYNNSNHNNTNSSKITYDNPNMIEAAKRPADAEAEALRRLRVDAAAPF